MDRCEERRRLNALEEDLQCMMQSWRRRFHPTTTRRSGLHQALGVTGNARVKRVGGETASNRSSLGPSSDHQEEEEGEEQEEVVERDDTWTVMDIRTQRSRIDAQLQRYQDCRCACCQREATLQQQLSIREDDRDASFVSGNAMMSVATTTPVPAALTQAENKKTLRLAQYLCGFAGLVLVNFIMFTDRESRAANAKDFIINFASDILAVGMVLLMADAIDRWKKYRADVTTNGPTPPSVKRTPGAGAAVPMSQRRPTKVPLRKPTFLTKPIETAAGLIDDEDEEDDLLH